MILPLVIFTKPSCVSLQYLKLLFSPFVQATPTPGNALPFSSVPQTPIHSLASLKHHFP